MSVAGRNRARRSEIRQRWRRRAKAAKLKAQYLAAQGDPERKQILDKLFKFAPGYPVERWRK